MADKVPLDELLVPLIKNCVDLYRANHDTQATYYEDLPFRIGWFMHAFSKRNVTITELEPGHYSLSFSFMEIGDSHAYEMMLTPGGIEEITITHSYNGLTVSQDVLRKYDLALSRDKDVDAIRYLRNVFKEYI